jgi:ADP-ribose pyrophosphatase
MFEFTVKDRSGREHPYYVASRSTEIAGLKAVTKENNPDGVIIYAVHKGEEDRIVMVRQYRYSIGDYIYELPAGLVDPGEDYHTSAVREMREETGLTLHPISVDSIYEKPYYTTIGMTDECCGTVYGYADGEISSDMLEDTEEIEVVLADREEVRRILREERVAIVCSYMLMHFLHDEEPFAFLKEKL